MLRKVGSLGLVLMLACGSALAAPKVKSNTSDSVRSSSAAPSAGKSNVNMDTSDFQLGLGVSTIGGLSVSQTGAGISTMFEISDLHAVQMILGLGIVGGGGAGLEFGGGLGYKFTLVGNRKVGFHLGGLLNFSVVPGGLAGFALTTTASHFFGMSIQPLAGFHFRFLDQIGASVDFGPRFFFVTTPTVITGFDLRQFGSLLGLSLHYFF